MLACSNIWQLCLQSDNILENKLDLQSTESFGVHKVKNIMDSAYVRDPKEYSSDMEVNYA